MHAFTRAASKGAALFYLRRASWPPAVRRAENAPPRRMASVYRAQQWVRRTTAVRPSITTPSCTRDEGSARLRWERVENDRFQRARHLFFQYRDKELSFTDCTSFANMRELRLTTCDHHRWSLPPGRVRRAARDSASKSAQAAGS